VSRLNWLLLLTSLVCATSAAADPFSGVSNLCQAHTLTGRTCWYSSLKKKCVCDPQPGAEGTDGGSSNKGWTAPAVGGGNTKPANPAQLFDKSQNESLIFLPNTLSKDPLGKEGPNKKDAKAKAKGQ
jgi:hypothetical protein